MGAGRGHLLPAGGGGGGGVGREGRSEPLAQLETLASCPNFYETVEEEQGSYDKLTKAYIRNEYILSYQSII